MSLQGKVAVITGSTSGIGLGIASILAKNGCSLIVTGLEDKTSVDNVVLELSSKNGVSVQFIAVDLQIESSIQKFITDIYKIYPSGIDILINNAGTQYIAQVEDYPMEKWNEMLAVSLTAPFLLIKGFIKDMKRKGWGRIVNTSSQMAVISAPGKAPYSAVKAGLTGFARGVALEGAPYGVTCNCVCPGFADAPLFLRTVEAEAKEQKLSIEEARKKAFEKMPSKKPVTIEQIAELVLFMCSDSGGSMNGSAVIMDGGFTSQ